MQRTMLKDESREKRAILSFLGDLASACCNIETSKTTAPLRKDLDALSKSMKALSDAQASEHENLEVTIGQFRNFSADIAKHTTDLQAQMVISRQQIQYAIDKNDQTFKLILQIITLSNQISEMILEELTLQNIMHQCSQNYLSPQLISPADLQTQIALLLLRPNYRSFTLGIPR